MAAGHRRPRAHGSGWVERGAALRWRLTGLAYGDQGLLVRRSLYDAAGGYPDTRIMEDVVLIRRIARLARVERLPAPILADARRWRREGRVRGTFRNAGAAVAVPRRRRAGPAGPLVSPRAAGPVTPAVAVFLKAPRPGTVKTRLAAEIGDRHAIRLYRVMAARTLAAVGAAGLEATIWFAPADAAAEMRLWLGEGWDLRPQASGDLGARLAAAEQAVVRGRGWLAIGADCPRLDAALLREAADIVSRGEVALGPSRGRRLLPDRRPHAAPAAVRGHAVEHASACWRRPARASRAPASPGASCRACATSTPPTMRAPKDS